MSGDYRKLKAELLEQGFSVEQPTGNSDAPIDQEDSEVAARTHQLVMSTIRSEHFAKLVQAEVERRALSFVSEALLDRQAEIEARVRELVKERFDETAEKIVRAKVDEAIAEVRKKL